MAVLGLTRLQAVNQILATIGHNRVTAVDSSGSWPSLTYGSSDAGDAEYWLDMVSDEVQLDWNVRFNVARMKGYAGGGNITFATNVIAIQPAGPNEDMRIELRADKAYDVSPGKDTDSFAAGTFYFNVKTRHDFTDCPPDVKVAIVREAALRFQRRKAGDTKMDNFLNEERVQSTTNLRPTTPPINTPPQGLPNIAVLGGQRQQAQ